MHSVLQETIFKYDAYRYGSENSVEEFDLFSKVLKTDPVSIFFVSILMDMCSSGVVLWYFF